MLGEAADFEHTVLLKSTDYERVEVSTLIQDENCTGYSAGRIEYVEGGEVTAWVDFDTSTKHAGQEQQPDNYENFGTDCNGGKHGKGKYAKSDYVKVVVEPLVKSNDCGYIVAGTVCYFEGNKWVATIDYGDGACDEYATKITADKDDPYTFSMDDWKDK